MIPIKKLGKMRINNRKNLEYCSLFECPRCGSRVIRPTGEGNRLTACSQSCSQLGIRRGPYKESVIWIERYEYDGAEWWDFKSIPARKQYMKNITNLHKGMWATLKEMNEE